MRGTGEDLRLADRVEFVRVWAGDFVDVFADATEHVEGRERRVEGGGVLPLRDLSLR